MQREEGVTCQPTYFQMESRLLFKLVTQTWDIMYGRKGQKFVLTGVQSEKYK